MYMMGLTSRQRPVRTRSTTKLMKPKPKPVAILKVRGYILFSAVDYLKVYLA